MNAPLVECADPLPLAVAVPDADEPFSLPRCNPAPGAATRTAGAAGTHDRQGMLLLHMPQVRLVAKSIWDRVRFAVELDDLVGYGMIGLVNAVDRFDPSRGILLKTYAEHRIRGAILDGLRGMDWLPRSARQRERQQRQEQAQGKEQQPAPMKTAELPRMEAVFSGGSLSDLERLVDSRRPRHSLCSGDNSPEGLCVRQQGFDRLADAVRSLPRRHREVVELYYSRELSMKQIGELLQVHESRVSQIHAAAIQRLRKHLSAGIGSDVRRVPDRAPKRHNPPARLAARRRDSRRRVAACQSSSVSTPTVSCAVSAT